jgi:DNA-binding beta-propeller fold protein YncE
MNPTINFEPMKRLFLWLALSFSFAVHAQEIHNSLKLEKTIPLDNVKGRIDHMAVDVPGQRLFVAALGNDTVEVVDLKAGKRIQSLSGFTEPQGIAYVPEFDKLFVANGSDGTCRILDGHSFKTLSTVQLGDDADNVRYGEKTKQIYVGYGSGALAVIDAKTGNKTADIKLSAHPESFRLDAESDRIFVNVPSSDEIALVDRQKEAVSGTWPVTEARANFPMILDAASHRVFVGCRRPAKLLVFDATNGQVKTTMPISGDTDDLFYDSQKHRIYVSCGEGLIDVIQQMDADHYKKLESIPTASGARTSLFIPELDLLCLAVPHRLTHAAEIRVFQTQ